MVPLDVPGSPAIARSSKCWPEKSPEEVANSWNDISGEQDPPRFEISDLLTVKVTTNDRFQGSANRELQIFEDLRPFENDHVASNHLA